MPAGRVALSGALHLTIALSRGRHLTLTFLVNLPANRVTTLQLKLPAQTLHRVGAQQPATGSFTLRDAGGTRSTLVYKFTLSR
jgi:hypothetical protein